MDSWTSPTLIAAKEHSFVLKLRKGFCKVIALFFLQEKRESGVDADTVVGHSEHYANNTVHTDQA